MTSPTFASRSEPLAAANPYRRQTADRKSLPVFGAVKAALPVPILPGKPDWVEMYWRAWEMAWSNLRRPTSSSGLVANFIDPACGNNIVMWDTAFMVQFGVYGRRAFDFIQSLNNFYAKQHEDGFICREISMDTGADYFLPFDPDATGPNILAWAEWRYYRISGDEERIAEVFFPLMAFHRWYRRFRTWPNGLYWATGLSSGMNNQTRVPDSERYHGHWTWVDATMQAAINCAVLENMAVLIGEKEYIAELENERSMLVRRINQDLWNPATCFYQDIDPNGRFSEVKSIGAYWGLIAKDLIPSERLDAFIQRLREKEAFNRPHRIPSQAADDPGYAGETGDCWRGGVWSPANFMVLKGLYTAKKHALVNKIACNHLENVWQVYARTDTFWDYYAPETAVPGAPARSNFVGATGIAPIAMLLEDVIGLWVDWPLRRVVWHRYLETDQHYGVQNYPLGPDGALTLIGDKEQIVVTTDVPFTLTIQSQELNLQAPIAAGKTEIPLS